jgi:hypothetical protein
MQSEIALPFLGLAMGARPTCSTAKQKVPNPGSSRTVVSAPACLRAPRLSAMAVTRLEVRQRRSGMTRVGWRSHRAADVLLTHAVYSTGSGGRAGPNPKRSGVGNLPKPGAASSPISRVGKCLGAMPCRTRTRCELLS